MAAESDTSVQASANPALRASGHFPDNPFHIRVRGQTHSDHATKRESDDRSEGSSRYAIDTVEQSDGHAAKVVRFLGDHHVLDVSALIERTPVVHMLNIGGFDLGGRRNVITLSLADILTVGETDVFIGDGKMQLMVNGKDGDLIRLSTSRIAGLSDGHWQLRETARVGDVIYEVVEHSSANVELLVEPAVRIELL